MLPPNPNFLRNYEVFWCINKHLFRSYKHARKISNLFLLVQKLSWGGGEGDFIYILYGHASSNLESAEWEASTDKLWPLNGKWTCQ